MKVDLTPSHTTASVPNTAHSLEKRAVASAASAPDAVLPSAKHDNDLRAMAQRLHDRGDAVASASNTAKGVKSTHTGADGKQLDHHPNAGTQPKDSHVKEPHVKDPERVAKAVAATTRVLRAVDRAALPINAAVDATRLHKAFVSDGGRIGPHTIHTAGGVVGGWAGGLAGAEAGSAAGAAGGALIGAAFGGVGAVPGAAIGAAVGGLVGGIAGAEAGSRVGARAADAIEDHR